MTSAPEDMSAPPKKKVKFTYMDKKVRGESVRLALFVGNIPFEDERISYEEIHKRRTSGALPLSQVPVLDIGDGRGLYAQSQGLLRWAGRQGGLYPEAFQLTIDEVTDSVAEILTEIIKIGYGSVMLRHPGTGVPMIEMTPEQRQEAKRMCTEELFPARFVQLEHILESNGGPYFCGKEITIADLSFYATASVILKGLWRQNGIEPACLDRCPKLVALVKQVDQHPRVIEWNALDPSRAEHF